MKVCKIEIRMDNDAFEENPHELEDILLELIDKGIPHRATEKVVLDSNGTKVGFIEIVDEGGK